MDDDDDDDDEHYLDEQIRQLHAMGNPLNSMCTEQDPMGIQQEREEFKEEPIHIQRSPVPPGPNEFSTEFSNDFKIDGDMQRVWGTDVLPRSDVAEIIRDTELEPTTQPLVFVKYLLCLEFIFKQRKDVTFLLDRVYTPPSQIPFILSRIDMNVSCLDACTPMSYTGTIYESIDIPVYIDRIDRLLRLTIQAGNVAKLTLSYGTEHKPEIMDHMPGLVERDLNPQQKLLNFIFQRACDQRLRRRNTAFYRPRLLADGTNSAFYEYACEIQDFMYRVVSPARIYPEPYDALTNKPSTPAQMIHLLTGLPDARCPFLDKARTLFSFSNGVFNAVDGSFETYDMRSNTSKSTSNFFDAEVTDELLTVDPMSIPTPHFDKILIDQRFDPCARRWMYILCGRLLHDVGTLDDWQVTLYIRGVAGSGKSSILKTMAMMYEASDIGFMMSDGQATFSDEHLYDKYIVMAMDLDKTTTFSATRINSMISGEKVSVNRKFKTALNETWRPPMVIASNAQPPWPDVAGNLMRRFPILTFNHPVSHSDPHLFEKLTKEVPMLLLKMARMYLEAIREYGNRSLWEAGILPTMCHDAKRQYLISSNPLAAFLASDQIVFQQHVETDSSEFRRAVIQFTKDHGDRRAESIGMINSVDHGHLFSIYNCTMVEITSPSGIVRTVIRGLTVVDGM
jgi:hypothetical protein